MISSRIRWMARVSWLPSELVIQGGGGDAHVTSTHSGTSDQKLQNSPSFGLQSGRRQAESSAKQKKFLQKPRLCRRPLPLSLL